MTAGELKNLAYTWSNMDRSTLEQAGIIKPGQIGGSDWTRFNRDPMMFVIKLHADRLEKLAEILNDEMAPHR